MLSTEDIMQLIQSLIWLLAGVGVFIVGMNFMSDALEKSAGYDFFSKYRRQFRVSSHCLLGKPEIYGHWYACDLCRHRHHHSGNQTGKLPVLRISTGYAPMQKGTIRSDGSFFIMPADD